MMNSEARKRLTAQADPVDEDLLETEARLRDALRDLGAENPLRLAVGLARIVHSWITVPRCDEALYGPFTDSPMVCDEPADHSPEHWHRDRSGFAWRLTPLGVEISLPGDLVGKVST